VPPTTLTHALSAKAIARLAQPRHLGALSETDAQAGGYRLVSTEHGAEHAPDHINLTLLVDNAGIVRQARFRSPAKDGQLAAYDVMAEQSIGRTLEDAARFTPRQADALLRDAEGGPVLELVATNHPDADHPFYVLRKALERYQGAKAVVEAAPEAAVGTAAALPWGEVGLFEKVRRIESVLDTHVRPALASDGGGIDLVDLKGDTLMVQYHGACGSCSSSIGGTLNFIQDSLNNHLGTQLAISVSGVDESIVGL
jgi:NifU-like protein